MTLDSFSVRIGESLQIWKISKLFTPLTETDPLSSHIGKNPPTLPLNTVPLGIQLSQQERGGKDGSQEK